MNVSQRRAKAACAIAWELRRADRRAQDAVKIAKLNDPQRDETGV